MAKLFNTRDVQKASEPDKTERIKERLARAHDQLHSGLSLILSQVRELAPQLDKDGKPSNVTRGGLAMSAATGETRADLLTQYNKLAAVAVELYGEKFLRGMPVVAE